MIATLFLSSVAFGASQSATYHFDTDAVGKTPAGWTSYATGSGPAGNWLVKAILDAPSGKQVVEQTDADSTEEAKSTGVMNRLIAERSNPQADVYWANEPIRAELKQQGISAPYVSPIAGDIPALFKDPDGHWTGFSARARVLPY
jgi:hypothetical protein